MERSEQTGLRLATEQALIELFGTERRLQRRDQLARHLTTAQFRVLMAFYDEETVPAGQLAKRAHLKPATITGMLDNLEESGIIERGIDPQDRRVSLVALTDKGRQIVEDRRANWDDTWDQYLGEFSEDELGLILNGLSELSELLDNL